MFIWTFVSKVDNFQLKIALCPYVWRYIRNTDHWIWIHRQTYGHKTIFNWKYSTHFSLASPKIDAIEFLEPKIFYHFTREQINTQRLYDHSPSYVSWPVLLEFGIGTFKTEILNFIFPWNFQNYNFQYHSVESAIIESSRLISMRPNIFFLSEDCR